MEFKLEKSTRGKKGNEYFPLRLRLSVSLDSNRGRHDGGRLTYKESTSTTPTYILMNNGAREKRKEKSDSTI